MSIQSRVRSLLSDQGTILFMVRVLRYLVAYTMVPMCFITRTLTGPIRRDDIWVVSGNSAGSEFTGNSKYLYLQLANANSDKRAIWITLSEEIKRELNNNGYEAYLASEPHGIYYSLRAGQVVTSNTLPIWTFGFTGGATSVQLWHGIPLKSLPAEDRGFDPWDLKSKLTTYNYLITNAEHEREAYEELLDFESVLPAGYPRNDLFYHEIDGSEIGVPAEAREQFDAIDDERTVIGYFPTWRGFDSDVPIDFGQLNIELEAMDAHLIVKAHRNQEFEIPYKSLERVDFLPSFGDPYPLFEEVDIMVTDYSSIYFDYLHLDRPIVFYTYDFEDYERERSFYLDFESTTPGPKANTFCELVERLRETCESDEYSDERDRVRQKVFAHQDANASQRIIESVASNKK